MNQKMQVLIANVALILALSQAWLSLPTNTAEYHRLFRVDPRTKVQGSSGKGFGKKQTRPDETNQPSNSLSDNSRSSTAEQRTIAVPPAMEPYTGPSPASGLVQGLLTSIPIADYGIILEVGTSEVVPGQLGVFIRLAPGITEATLPSGSIIGAYSGEFIPVLPTKEVRSLTLLN